MVKSLKVFLTIDMVVEGSVAVDVNGGRLVKVVAMVTWKYPISN